MPVCKNGNSKNCRPAGENLDSGSFLDDPKEKPVVNTVLNHATKDEKPPPPPPKYDDGYEHKKMEHIKVSQGTGSYQEAVKEFYIDEARKTKEKMEKAKAKREAAEKAE